MLAALDIEPFHLSGTTCLPINLPHHDIDRPDDRGNVGDQATPANLVRHAQIPVAARLGPDTQRDVFLARPADDVEAHLPPRAFGFDVAFARVQVPRWLNSV